MANAISRDFVSEEQRNFHVKLGSVLASALSGFIAGVIITTIIWMAAFYFLKILTR